MLGVIINSVAVAIGSLIGLIFKSKISEKISKPVMVGLGVCVLYIGISGSFEGENVLIAISSIVLGVIVGTILKIDDSINKVATKIENKFKKEDNTESISEGLVTATLLFCIGAMTITGSIQSGLTGDNSILITKSILDFVSSIMLAASLGKGVILSSISLFISQGLLVLLSSIIAPYINDTVINDITCVGSLIIILIGTNLMGITKIKVADFLPAILFSPVIYYISDFVINLFN
ncbi:MAG: DUF554 domain-containing protein [Bacilli bacterium]|nr:DUF554 domain-containing protein [Bacilli bacterium]